MVIFQQILNVLQLFFFNPFLDSLSNFGFKNIRLTPGIPKECFQHPQDVVHYNVHKVLVFICFAALYKTQDNNNLENEWNFPLLQSTATNGPKVQIRFMNLAVDLSLYYLSRWTTQLVATKCSRLVGVGGALSRK